MCVITSLNIYSLTAIQAYDGVRRRALPVLFDTLKGTEDDRTKGALWTINMSSFGKYAITGKVQCKRYSRDSLTYTEASLANDLISRLFGCQRNETVRILFIGEQNTFEAQVLRHQSKTVFQQSSKIASLSISRLLDTEILQASITLWSQITLYIASLCQLWMRP